MFRTRSASVLSAYLQNTVLGLSYFYSALD
jgi:hypothetical protein